MLRTPRSVAVCLALLCGIAVSAVVAVFLGSRDASVATFETAALHSQSASPSDRVFLTERFPVRTHSGLTGFPPGMALHVVSTNGDTFRVSDGTLTFDVPKAKLTTDPNLAARLTQNNYAAVENAVQESAQQMEAYRQAEAAKRAQQEQQAAVMRQAQQQQEAEIEQQEEAAAQQQQRQLEVQQKQAAKIAAQKQAQRTTGYVGDDWVSYRHTFPGGYEEMSGNARMGHRHSESHPPHSPNEAWTGNSTDEEWGPAR